MRKVTDQKLISELNKMAEDPNYQPKKPHIIKKIFDTIKSIFG